MVSFTIFYTNGALSRWDKTPVLWKCEMKSVELTWHTSRHFRGELTKKKIFFYYAEMSNHSVTSYDKKYYQENMNEKSID